ncbi:MAG: molybdenum ABC transporter ATP-binding protein [Desulfuromonas sp.]|nr:MAG: molybdenum ABC transporter ATP-binding protein [Desulfuromonas sp.]
MKLDVDLEKRFGSFHWSAGFSVEGERVGVFGPSGSGKSTLMHMLAGLLKPDSGSIYLDGEPLFDVGRRVNLSPQKRRIGVVFQQAHLFPHLGVERNLLFGYNRLPKEERKVDPAALVPVLGLEPLMGRSVTTLSGGERQRVALGRTLLSSPRLILMDEPLTGLDAERKYQIIPYLKKVFAEFGIPLLFISHSLNEMRLMTEQVLELTQGKLSAQISADALALRRMGSTPDGFTNLMELRAPQVNDGLASCRWGEQEVILSGVNDPTAGMYALSSKDITLFKRHPEATSARNLFRCKVVRLFAAGRRTGVELDCQGQRLVSQVVADAARDLELVAGGDVVAVIKASAFRRLY